MALLERYLDAVGRHLPPDQEEDILAELRDDIQAKYDQRAEQLGNAGIGFAVGERAVQPRGLLLLAPAFEPAHGGGRRSRVRLASGRGGSAAAAC